MARKFSLLMQQVARKEPYRALAMGVVIRAKKDAEGRDIRLSIGETAEVTRDELRPWVKATGWPWAWVEEEIEAGHHK